MEYYLDNIERLSAISKNEIEETYQKCKNNKNLKYFSQAKKDWYYKQLKERIQRKVYRKYQLDFFGIICRTINGVLPEVIENNIDRFVNIRNVGIGG